MEPSSSFIAQTRCDALEDETGISNVVIRPDLFEAQRVQILSHPWIIVDQVVHILANQITLMPNPLEAHTRPHDFH